MRYSSADAMRTALEQRLRNEATTTGVALIRLRKRVAFERFLARLAVARPDWVLKGAFALELRLGLQTSTRAKDLVDLVLVARHASPNAERLRQALRSTFERYGKPAVPGKRAVGDWEGPARRWRQ